MGDKEEFWQFGPKMQPGPEAEGLVCGGASSPNCLFLTELHCLPWFINISESQGPGSVLQSFSFNCTSHKPTLELVRVKPSTTFFNLPSLSRRQQVYVGTVGSWAQMGTMGGQGQALNSPGQRLCRGTEHLESPMALSICRR